MIPCGDGSGRVWGGESGRRTQAMVPEPDDDPKPDDEPDDETDDEPDDETDDEPDDETDDEPDEERDDEPDDEGDDEPEPGTLYFGEDDGWTAQSRCSPTSRPSRQAERARWAGRI